MPTELAVFGKVIDNVYRAATEPDLWPSALAAVAHWINAPKAILFTPQNTPGRNGFAFMHGIAQATLEQWSSCYQPQDFWLKRAAERRLLHAGCALIDSDLHSEDELLRTPWYREFLVPQDIGRLAALTVFRGEPESKLVLTALSLYRSRSAAAFEPDDKERLELLYPHLTRALGVWRYLCDGHLHAASSYAALNRLSIGVLLLSGSGELVFANTAAQKVIDEGDGLRIVNTESGRYISAIDDLAQRQLCQALDQSFEYGNRSLSAFPNAIEVPRRCRRGSLRIRLSSVGSEGCFGEPYLAHGIIAFIEEDLPEKQIDASSLQRWGRLTRSETALALELMQGGELAEIAKRTYRSVNTIKTHTQHLYAKLGVGNRAEFVKSVLSQGWKKPLD